MRLVFLFSSLILFSLLSSLYAQTGKDIVTGAFVKHSQAQDRNEKLQMLFLFEPEVSRLQREKRFSYDIRRSGKYYLSVLSRFEEEDELSSVFESIRKIYPDAYLKNSTIIAKPVESEQTKSELKLEKSALKPLQSIQISTGREDDVMVIAETAETEKIALVNEDEVDIVASSEPDISVQSDSSVLIYALIVIAFLIIIGLLMMRRGTKTRPSLLDTLKSIEIEPGTTVAGKAEQIEEETAPKVYPVSAAQPEPIEAVEIETIPEEAGKTVPISEMVEVKTVPESVPGPRKKRLLKPHEGIITKESLADFSGNRILVAEDNVINQKVIIKLLEGSGLEVAIANNGQEALDMLSDDPDFNMVLMDAHMPIKDGFEATREIRQNILYEPIVVVALSGDVSSDDIRKMREAGMQEQLAKPLRVEALYNVMYQYLDLAESEHTEHVNEREERAVLDSAEGIDICGGDRVMYEEILDDFIHAYRMSGQMVDAYLQTNDAFKLVSLMLDMKGVGGNIGAMALSDSAEALRKAVMANETGRYAVLQKDFKVKLTQLFEAIRVFKSSSNGR